MVRLTRLLITDFRNHPALTLHLGRRIVVFHGPNGSGKTNLLEAVSLLVPGRGLRSARNADLARRGSDGPWSVVGRFSTPAGDLDIGTGKDPNGALDRRVFRINGAAPRNQAEITSRIAVIWLTPQMDRLFQDPTAARRRFLDRLVWSLEPDHARDVAAHDAAMYNRNRLLGEGSPDQAWLTALEDAMARHGVAATAARLSLVQRLNAVLSRAPDTGFPTARIDIGCPIADQLRNQPAVAVEAWLKTVLARNREADTRAGGASLGAHRTEMLLEDAHTGTQASIASTGEQHALLVSLILGHATLVGEARGFPPLLLLDEPLTHLDHERRMALFDTLLASPAQTLITGTDEAAFAPLVGEARFFALTRTGVLTGD